MGLHGIRLRPGPYRVGRIPSPARYGGRQEAGVPVLGRAEHPVRRSLPRAVGARIVFVTDELGEV